jgi:hypothetical protein
MEGMKDTKGGVTLCLAAMLAGFVAGCAASLCQPGEPSVNCCIKKFPLSPVESCGVTEAEALGVLSGILVAAGAATAAGDEDDFANNAHLPEWKQECIRNYVACKSRPGWKGPCYDCLRRCEGQQQWPFRMCSPSGTK